MGNVDVLVCYGGEKFPCSLELLGGYGIRYDDIWTQVGYPEVCHQCPFFRVLSGVL